MSLDAAHEEMEREANYFAMCLLMPEEWIRKDFEKMRETHQTGDLIGALAKRYHVEEFIVTLRLADLKLLRS